MAAAVAVATAGTPVLIAVSAQAAVPAFGSQLGALVLSPTSGPTSISPTWTTANACPSGFQGSAVLAELNTDGSIASTISPVVASVTTPFGGTLLPGDTVGSVLSLSNVTDARTVEWVVECASGAGVTGNLTWVQATDVTLSVDGSSYTTSCTQTTMCLIPANGASSLTPTWATIAACPAAFLFSAALYTLNADGSLGTRISPLVSSVGVPFGGTLLGDVAQNMSGTGVTNGEPDEWAVVCFTGTGGTGATDINASVYVTLSADGSSYSTRSTLPQPTFPGTTAGTVSVAIAVPATGILTVTVAAGPVNLAVSGLTGTGILPTVTITDTRNSFPGWSVMGQESAFTSTTTPPTPISGDQLGWSPTAVNAPLPAGAILGGTVLPANPGLGTTAAVLALAHAGTGADPTGATNDQVSASLTLDIPVTATAGVYSGILTITYLSAQA